MSSSEGDASERLCRECGGLIPDERRADAKHCSDGCKREFWADSKAEDIAEDVKAMVKDRLREVL